MQQNFKKCNFQTNWRFKKDLKIVNNFIRSNNLKNVFTYGHIKMNYLETI